MNILKVEWKKVNKFFKKGFVAVSCATFLGVGIGAGYVIAQNYISTYEKNNFSFDKDAKNNDMSTQAINYQASGIAKVFEQVSNSVVNISTLTSSRGIFSSVGSGSGSGIIYKIDNDDVYIITNNHVIENATTVTISVTGKEQISAKFIGSDPSSDIAIIATSKKLMEDAGITDIKPAKFADSDQIKVGDFVFPIGNALGRGKTITQGIISAQNKQINVDGTQLTVLQTDAAINPGNSGGALINYNGEVVGINTAKLSSYAIEGIGYAIPSNIALKVANNIIQNGSTQKPYLGIQGQTITPEIKEVFNLFTDGVLIVDVEEGGSAEKAGLIPTDIITQFDGKEIKTLEDLSKAIQEVKNDVVNVTVIRNGFQEINIEVKLTNNKKFMNN